MEMKLLSLLLTGLTFTFFSPLKATAADVCHDEYSILRCGNGTIYQINHFGNVFLDGTQVTGELTVIGNLDANNAELSTASITGHIDTAHVVTLHAFHATGTFNFANTEFDGPTNLTGNLIGKHDQFKGETEIIGNVNLVSENFSGMTLFTGLFNSNSSQFSQPITLNTCLAKFSQSQTSYIQVNPQPQCQGNVQKLYLSNHTTVGANIIFTGGHGEVYLDQTSQIQGHIAGGKIIRQ